MLEANVYDNFNPNYYNISDFNLPNGKKDKRGLPIPKARCQVINYELWETGYLYTSSATLTVSVEVGDIVQILFPEVSCNPPFRVFCTPTPIQTLKYLRHGNRQA